MPLIKELYIWAVKWGLRISTYSSDTDSVYWWWVGSMSGLAEGLPPTEVSAAMTFQWRHNERDGVSNHDCLLNCLFRRRSKKTWKLRVTGLCEGNSPLTGEFPSQRTSNAENVSIWWRHHDNVTTLVDFRITGPLWGESVVTDGFPSQMAINEDI